MHRKNNSIATQLKALSEMSYGKYSDTCLRDVPYNIYDEKTHRGVLRNINTKKSNTLLGDENITLCGNEYVFANIGDLKFKISPNSFFRLIQSKRKNFIQLPKNMPV